MPQLTKEFLTKLMLDNPARIQVKILREKGKEEVVYDWHTFKHRDIADREGIEPQNVAFAGGLLLQWDGNTLILDQGGHSIMEYQPDSEETKITLAIIQGLLGQIDPSFKIEEFKIPQVLRKR